MEISIIILCLILAALFSGMEIAFISSNKIYLEIEKKQQSFLSKILTKLTEKPSRFIASMLIGNTIVLVIYGFFMGELLMRWIVQSFFSDLCQYVYQVFCASGVFFLRVVLLYIDFHSLDF